MFTGQGASFARRRLLRFWSMTLSAVLAITLLQVAPPAKANEPLNVNLVARFEDTNGVAASLAGSTITGTDSTTNYRLDLSLSCGFLEPGPFASNVSSPADNAFVGLAADIQIQLNALRIIRSQGPDEWDMPIDCSSSSRVTAYLSPYDDTWTEITGSTIPQGSSNYFIGSDYPFPTLTTFDSQDNFLTTSRLNTFSNGFEIEWDQFEGSIGYTPAGYSVRYREVFNGESQRGPWIYQRSDDGRLKSLVVQDPVSQGPEPAFQYEVEVAPTVIDCDSNRLFGKFESVPFVGGFGLDTGSEASLAPANPQMITGEVDSQCYAECTPVETTVFDGTNLATIFKFTNTDPCNWTVPSNLTSTTVDAYVVGGGGGGGAAGGGGGGGGGVQTSLGLAIDTGTTWTMMAGLGGPGAQDVNATQGDSGANSVVIHPNTNESGAIVALGGGGGGSKDQLGINSASVISGGNGINTGATQAMSYGGSSSSGSGSVGTSHDLIEGKLYGTGGGGADGSSSGSSFVPGVFGSGGGGGAVCSQVDALSYSGGNSQNSGDGGNCVGNSQASLDGDNAEENSGGGGGGGARDFDFGNGAGGAGATGVIYIVHTETPLARYNPSGCFAPNGIICEIWYDTTSNQDLTATVFGAPAITSTSDHESFGSISSEPFPVVQGIPSDSIVFPALITPSSGYTLFTVARYNEIVGGQYRRIFDSAVTPDVDSDSDDSPEGINWLSGFWGGKSGVAYHGDSPTSSYQDRNWLTSDETSIHNANWVLSTDQKNLYRSNGTKRSLDNYAGGVGPEQIVVNQVNRTESSDFQIADIITFGRELNADEYQAVEAYLSVEYGICIDSCSPPPPSDPPVFETDSQLTNGEFGTAYTQIIEATSPDANPISYEVTDGGLPTGLTLDATSGELSGTPTALGTFTFTVKATNSVNNLYDTAEFTINVYASGPVGCKDYRNASFVPDHFILDETTGYAIGCDPTGQEILTPVVSDNPSSSRVESWSQQFDSEAKLEFFRLRNGYKCDDCYVGIDGVDGTQGFPLGFEINYYGETYNSVFVNSNGSISFTAGSDCYDEPLVDIMKCDGNSTSAVVAYGVDLDNSDLDPGKFLAGPEVRHADFFYWGKTLVGGKDAFVATWMNSPGYCSDDIDSGASFYAPDDYDFDVCDDWEVNGTLSTFQIVLVDQSISAETSGDADVIINYGSMQDSQNGYPDCEGPCDSNQVRALAAGLGKATLIPGNPNTWDYSITSLSAVHNEPPVEILYNGLSAADAADGGTYALSEATQGAGSTAGRFVYEFRNDGSPEVATAPSPPSVSLDSSTLSSASLLVSPPSDQGGAPVSSYEVRYRIQGTLQWTVATTNLSYAEPTASYSLTRLQSGQSYEVEVAAYNGIGTSSFSEPITVAALNSHESDVDFGGFEWLRVGAGIGNVVTDAYRSEGEPPAILSSGSMRAYWIPSVYADPLTDGIEITCADTSDSSVTESAGYSTLTCEEMDLSSVQPGLTAQLIRNFAASDPWHQISIKLDNDLTESVTGAIAYRIDLASGSNTEIEMTSDGDLYLENADKWFVTTDNSDTNRPASLHYFGTTDGQVYPDGPGSDAGKFWIKKPFTVDSDSIQTHRFIDGFTKLAPQETTGEAVIVAMKAADQLEHQQWDGSSNILSSDISDVISEDRDLPSLRIQYECRDFGRNLLYPVLVQNDGQPIGCNFSDEINEGLFPSEAQTNKDDDWNRLFKSTFPNATPRLGWACDTCVITSEGPVEPGLPGSSIADGLPLGFTTSIDGDVVDSIRISPKGYVQLHESGAEDDTNGHMVAAFANQELNNGILQGEWSQLPDFDFFYWGRTEYQGRLAFVVTWVMIPTLNNESIINEDPTTMQLMFVSDRTESTLNDYLENPDDASVSNVDIVWNFHSIQGGSSGGIVSSQGGGSDSVSTYSGIFDSQLSGLPLISNEFMSDNQTGLVGNGSVDCDASCVAGNLLTNRLQSPVDGRYVLGYRTYEIVFGDPDGPPYIPARGILAPAAPREVEVVRTVGSSATVSWRAPLPWVLRTLEFPDGTNPIYGYRVEYAVNTRGENTECDSPGPGPLPQSCAVVFPSVDDPPLSSSDESLIVLGPDDTERISITIPELDEKEQYTFRVFAVYSGLDFPNSEDMPIETMEFYSEVRSAPATANEVYESDLEIVTAASQPSQAFAAEGLAEMLSGNLEVSNATINGSPYPYGQTEKSVGSFTGGETSIGFDSGIILTPLVDARTFQRGSGITSKDSDSKTPRYFLDPAHRSKYEQIAADFTEFMSQQKSWVPGDGYSPVFDCEVEPACAFGTTTLQFDIEKPTENDFLKFEYVLAGLESTTFSGGSGTAEVYNFPDGFGLFVGGIDQASSCALVPQTDNQTDQERFMSMGNALNSRLASEVGFDSDLNSETVTSVMSCVFDVSEIESDSVTVTMAIANANDSILSTAVFLKSNSIRFEETAINSIDIPAATERQTYDSLTFTTSGSTQPFRWTSDGLPLGMELTSEGELTGTPTESGSFNFTVTALGEDDAILATQSFTILVIPDNRPNRLEDDRFLQGNYVEVGIGGNGHFGSTGSAPLGYHPRDTGGGEGPGDRSSSGRLGFISDRDRDGWGTGYDDGDFFIPGTPFEGFGLEVGQSWLFNDHETTDIPGTTGSVIENDNGNSHVWTSVDLSNGLKLTQTSSVPISGQRLDVTVTLENTSNTDVDDVYYSRQVDPDNSVNSGCSFQTDNTIVAQGDSSDGVSLVSATTNDSCRSDYEESRDPSSGSYLGLISTDSRSRVGLENFGFFAKPASAFYQGGNFCARDSSDEEEEYCDVVTVEPGSFVSGDSGIGISFDVGTILSGDTTTLTFSYILSPEQAQDIIDQHNSDNDIVAPVITASRSSFVAAVGAPFTLQTNSWLNSSGGAVSYYTISPDLPGGLSLNAETGEITGTPLQAVDTSSFTITAHNLAGSSSVEFLLAATNGPYLFNDMGRVFASWPSVGANPEYVYQLSTDLGDTWGGTFTVENSSPTLITVEIIGDGISHGSGPVIGDTWMIRVRNLASEAPWQVSSPFYFGLTGCTSLNPQLKVLMLSTKPNSGTSTRPATSDSEILSAACSSPFVSVEIFDGQGYGEGSVMGSADAWRDALEDIDVVLLPSLVGNDGIWNSAIMSIEAFEVLRNWVFDGGRIVLTGAASYVNDLNRFVYLNEPEDGQIQSETVPPGTGVRRYNGASTSLPPTLATYGIDGLDLSGLGPGVYVSNYGEADELNSTSLVTSFMVAKGWIVALSNDFVDTDASWNKVLKQSIHSSLNLAMIVKEADTFWAMQGAEISGYSINESDIFEVLAGGAVRIGSETSPTTISCINTPSNPAIISKRTEGTTVRCGSVTVDDGIVETSLTVRLTRFFAADSPWVKTSISIDNNDRENLYLNSAWYGGDLEIGNEPLLEIEGQKQNLLEEFNSLSQIAVASDGDNISNDYEAGDGRMVVRVNPSAESENLAGLGLEGHRTIARNQFWSKTNFFVEPRDSIELSWFESYARYDSGCDRMASLNAWNQVENFLSNSISENTTDGFKSNSRLRFPNLSDIDCQAFTQQVDEIQVTDLGGSVRLIWDRVEFADKYEISYRLEGADSWTYLDEIAADANDTSTYLVQELSEGLTYEFRVRPIREDRNEAGDTGKGAWRESALVTVSTAPSPSNSPSPSQSPSPSNSPSPSQPPVVNNPGPDLSSTIVPQMIAQTGPGFPARLKRGKTVKFGMTAPSGLPLQVTSVGQCKTTKITKTVTVKVLVGKKIKKKKVKMQTGWAVKATKKKGLCTVTFSNSGDATRNPLAAAGTITVF